MPLPTTLKLGAFCPTLISGPTRVIGFPRIVTAPLRSSAMREFSLGDELKKKLRTSQRLAASVEEVKEPITSPRGRCHRHAVDVSLRALGEGAGIKLNASALTRARSATSPEGEVRS